MRNNEEYNIQCQVVDYLTAQYPNVLYNADCGGVRYGSGKEAIIRGARMKRAGHKAGYPDLIILSPSERYHAMFIELKSLNGVLSDEQEQWLEELDKRGYYAVVCYGFDEAKIAIDNYLKSKS